MAGVSAACLPALSPLSSPPQMHSCLGATPPWLASSGEMNCQLQSVSVVGPGCLTPRAALVLTRPQSPAPNPNLLTTSTAAT